MSEDFCFNHIGAAVIDLNRTINTLEKLFGAKMLSNIVYDPIQEVTLVLLNVGGITVELVRGKKVNSFIFQVGKLNFYHVCYETRNFNRTVEKYNNTKGLIMLAPPAPAILFNNRRTAFFIKKDVGLIEILEGDKI